MLRICKVIWIIIPIIIIGLIVSCCLCSKQNTLISTIPEFIYRAQQRRIMLLCDTDHQALLKAGREILSKIPKDRFHPHSDGGIDSGIFSVPEGIQIPQAIKDLKSGFVVDYDGYLRIEMHGGMDHFGVKIYPEDYKKPRDYFEYGDRELLPGLWYYDDGYLNNPEYDKKIDELIEKHKKKK